MVFFSPNLPSMIGVSTALTTARAGSHHFRRLSALRAHTKLPYKTDLHRKTRRPRNRPRAARADAAEGADLGEVDVLHLGEVQLLALVHRLHLPVCEGSLSRDKFLF